MNTTKSSHSLNNIKTLSEPSKTKRPPQSKHHKRRKRNIIPNCITGLGIATMAASGVIAGLSGAATFGNYEPQYGDQFFDNDATFSAAAAAIPTGAVLTTAGLLSRK
ncbi:MAG: hypothetical protein ACJARD_000815 [Alphaproteobacteria bacterium]|jgi:hypothetical protein